jgi:hypothetical protein
VNDTVDLRYTQISSERYCRYMIFKINETSDLALTTSLPDIIEGLDLIEVEGKRIQRSPVG